MSPTMSKVAKLSALLESDVPCIAVSFTDEATGESLARAMAEGLDVAEIRIDRFKQRDAAYVQERVRRFSMFPTIATIRTRDEGGSWNGSDDERLELFSAALPEVDAVDIELSSSSIIDAVIAQAHALGRTVIVSNHNFNQTPSLDDLEQMALRAKRRGADYVKLSAMTQSADDLRTLAEFTLKNRDLGLIVIGMGQHGTPSRVFFPFLGSRLTYAFGSKWPVPGQLSFVDTFNVIREVSPEFNERKVIELELIEDA